MEKIRANADSRPREFIYIQLILLSKVLSKTYKYARKNSKTRRMMTINMVVELDTLALQ